MRQIWALIGFKGVGKSTLAPLLAQKLGWKVRDLDEEMEKRFFFEQKRVKCCREIYQTLGAQGFREMEKEVLVGLAEEREIVLALGGGVIHHPQSCEVIQEMEWVSHLEASFPFLWERIRLSGIPALGGKEELKKLYAQRKSVYRFLASDQVWVEGKSVEESVLALMRGRDGT